jgi:hypothetical protein
MVAVLALAVGANASGPQSADPHLRPAALASQPLVAASLERSLIVNSLAEQLKATDVVAYVVTAPDGVSGRDSAIHFLGRSKAQRFMVITVNSALPEDRQIALVGHELQHAVDMSRAKWVTDQERMSQYFTRVGWRIGDVPGYETLSAMQTERKVGKELITTAQGAGSAKPRPR